METQPVFEKVKIFIEGKWFEIDNCKIWVWPEPDSPRQHWKFEGMRNGKECTIFASGTFLVEIYEGGKK